MIKLKSILSEDDVSANFGQVAFGEDPRIAKMQGKKTEKDTDFELKILDILVDWTKRPDENHAEVLYKNFDLFKRVSVKFPQILKPSAPDGTQLYRGVTHPNKKLLSNLKKSKKQEWSIIKFGPEILYKYEKPITYTPHMLVQSWTRQKSKAVGFSYGEFGDQRGIVLSTKQNDEFLFNEKFIKYINFFGQNEYEVLHFGKTFKENVYINVSENFWKKIK